jgi:hypothetical protein
MYVAAKGDKGWRVSIGDRHICGCLSEQVARDTAAALNAYRTLHR